VEYEQRFVVFRALLRWFEDPEAQAFFREQDEREQREQAAGSSHSMILRSGETLSEMQTKAPKVKAAKRSPD
jgi:hypothetical protein